MASNRIRYVDHWSFIVIFLTLVLFISALFIKGFTHELLLEAGVFLVSAKLVIMAHKSAVLGERLQQQLDGIQETLRQLEDTARAK